MNYHELIRKVKEEETMTYEETRTLAIAETKAIWRKMAQTGWSKIVIRLLLMSNLLI